MRIGVLALQGAFAAHAEAITAIGAHPVLVRDAQTLLGIDGLVLPGGESTVQLKLLDRLGMTQPLGQLVAAGIPVLATCAGVVLAASHVENPVQASFGWLDVTVTRNGWGRQVASFEDEVLGQRVPFIRAPRITRVGRGVDVLATLRGEPVLIRQRHVVGATFHPELTENRLFHELAFRAKPVTTGRIERTVRPAGDEIARKFARP
jgi:pyridoxal 5'-phosphate synthase pdxT subunit